MLQERKVLFVCSGNTCRSPMAQYLLRWMAEKRGIRDIFVDSAGVSVRPGTSLSPEARDQIRETTGSHPPQRPAKCIEDVDLSSFTDILCMQECYKKEVLSSEKVDDDVVKTLGEVIGEPAREVADPYGQGTEAYRSRASLLREMIEKWLDMNYPTSSRRKV